MSPAHQTFAELSAQYGPDEANRICRAQAAERNARRAQIAAWMRANGFASVAELAAGALVDWTHPEHAFGGTDDRLAVAQARKAISAYEAALARKAA